MKSLGARLDCIAELLHRYGPFSCLADIGSDHAFLACRALQKQDAKTAVASDIREGPLENGRRNALQCGVSPLFRLSDGFDGLRDFSFDGACICGMGGELIADILLRYTTHRYGNHPDCTFFLQPMTAQDDLRRFLWNNGYTVLAEHYTVERGKPYAVLVARHTGVPTAYCYADLFLGQFRPTDDASFVSYARKVRSQAEKRKKGLLTRGLDSTDEDALLSALKDIE